MYKYLEIMKNRCIFAVEKYKKYREVEQRQLARFITWRSEVRILPSPRYSRIAQLAEQDEVRCPLLPTSVESVSDGCSKRPPRAMRKDRRVKMRTEETDVSEHMEQEIFGYT